MQRIYKILENFHDSLEGKVAGFVLGTAITAGIASDLPRALSTSNYKLAACEIGSATYFGAKTYLRGGKILKEAQPILAGYSRHLIRRMWRKL